MDPRAPIDSTSSDSTRRPRRGATVAIVAGIAAVVLGGTGVVLAVTAPRPAPAQVAESSPRPSPEPPAEPAAPPLDAPLARIPAACTDLAPAELVDASFGAHLDLVIDESSSPAGVQDVRTAQSGALHCVWGGGARTDGAWDRQLELWVVPDARSDYESTSGERTWGSTHDTLGDSSASLCRPDGALACSGEVLVDDYWMTVRLRGEPSPAIDTATADARLQAVGESAVAALRAAGPSGDAWTAPGDVYRGEDLCGEAATAAAATAFGVPLEVIGTEFWDGPTDAQYLAIARTGFNGCPWYETPAAEGGATVTLLVAPGGAWVFQDWAESAPAPSWYYGEYSPTTLAGTESAFVACNLAECSILGSVGGSLVELVVDIGHRANAEAMLAAGLPR